MKKAGLLLLSLVFALAFTACGDSLTGYNSYEETGDTLEVNGFYESDDYSDYAEDESNYDEAADEEESVSNRKLIKTYDVNLETEDFAGTMSLIESEVSRLGGYIEYLKSSNGSFYTSYRSRYASLTVRIPAGEADNFLNIVGENTNITDQSLDVEDVTLSYVDIESKKDAYTTEQDRLLELLDKAESMEDILAIEERLTEVRYELESMESKLRTYDNLVDYSTFNIYVDEVTTYTEPEPETFGEKVASSFKEGLTNTYEGLENFFIWFVGALPAILVLGLISAIIILIIILVNKSKKRKGKTPYLKVKEENKKQDQ